MSNWATPNVDDVNNLSRESGCFKSLTRDAAQWATPNAHDATGARGKGFELADRHYRPHDLCSQSEGA
jgi:hypothetical protein